MFAWESWIVDFITQNLKTFIVNFFRFLLNIRCGSRMEFMNKLL